MKASHHFNREALCLACAVRRCTIMEHLLGECCGNLQSAIPLCQRRIRSLSVEATFAAFCEPETPASVGAVCVTRGKNNRRTEAPNGSVLQQSTMRDPVTIHPTGHAGCKGKCMLQTSLVVVQICRSSQSEQLSFKKAHLRQNSCKQHETASAGKCMALLQLILAASHSAQTETWRQRKRHSRI